MIGLCDMKLTQKRRYHPTSGHSQVGQIMNKTYACYFLFFLSELYARMIMLKMTQ